MLVLEDAYAHTNDKCNQALIMCLQMWLLSNLL